MRRGAFGLLRGWAGACSEGAFMGFVLLFLREARALRVFMCLPAGAGVPPPPAIQFQWDHFRDI